MLPLSGTASDCQGFDVERAWQVIRLRSPDDAPRDDADAALIRVEDDAPVARQMGFKAIVGIGQQGSVEGAYGESLLLLPAKFSYLTEGDIIGLQPGKRRFRTLYRRSSAHNSFLVTERCNHYCLMCSQPPRDVDDSWLFDQIEAAIGLVDPSTRSFTFTGGEPLLESHRLIRILERCRDTLPNTAVHVLTNGRAFANGTITRAWASVRHPKLMAGIPLYSAVDHIHDYVVQASGAFDETVLGILRLKDADQRVELRVVLHAITASKIFETCLWIARNLPFLDHVALMGLENTGFTLANGELLWIDPIDYQQELERAVEVLATNSLPISIYNLPRCVLPRSIWPHAVQSISDWKNGYAEECEACIERPRCAGFFTSGRPRRSRAISPILK